MMSHTKTIQDLQSRIQTQASRLADLTSAEDKRVKKRVLQNLGKLKKQLQEVIQSQEKTPKREEEEEREEEEGGGVAPSLPVWNKKKAKLKLKIVNKEIADLALKKQLKMAIKRFNWLGRKGLRPDVHSYTNLLNAFVRCGDMSGAESLWAEMISGSVSIAPNVVTCTAMVKGYCEASCTIQAKDLFLRMLRKDSADISNVNGTNEEIGENKKKKKLIKEGGVLERLPVPNSRTLNTLLRGCIRCGEVVIADEVFAAVTRFEANAKEQSETSALIDETSIEYLIALYCQSLNIEAAEQLYQLFCTNYRTKESTQSLSNLEGIDVLPHAHSQLSAICVSLSRAYALIGQHNNCDRYEQLARSAIKKGKSNILLEAMKSTAGSAGSTSGSTTAMFQQHRYAELTRDCDNLKAHCSNRNSQEGGSNNEDSEIRNIVNFLSRVLLLDGLTPSEDSVTEDQFNPGDQITQLNENCTESSALSRGKRKSKHSRDGQQEDWFCQVQTQLVKNVLETFGLENLCSIIPSHQRSRSIKKEAINKILQNTSPATKKEEGRQPTKSGYCIRFDKLFNLSSSDSTKGLRGLMDDNLDVKLEIGSGSGEWAVEQAIADHHHSDTCDGSESGKKVIWVSVEQRLDRVYQTFLHSFLRYSEPHNLAMIAGDASVILPELIHDQCIQQIFVNHPEPPERSSGGEDMSQGQHLLTGSFFVEMHRVLKVGGSLTIVSDNRLYANALAKTVEGLNSELGLLFQSPLVEKAGGRSAPKDKTIREGAFAAVGAHTSSDSDSDSDEEYAVIDDCSKKRKAVQALKANTANSITVWSGDPGESAGHVAQHVSSYFSRLWKNGNKSRVWYLYLRKCGTPKHK